MNRKWVLICSLILFILACLNPALEFRRNENGVEVWGGAQVLCTGWLGLLIGHFAWLANPFLVGSAVMLWRKRRVPCVVCAVLALLISLDTLRLFVTTLPGDEGGVSKLFLRKLLVGSYLWESSILVMLIGGLLFRVRPDVDSVLETLLESGEAFEGDLA